MTPIEELQTTINTATHTLNTISKYPDIAIHTNRWHKTHYTSATINPKATHCDIHHNCGCCNDSPLEAWPYLIDNGIKIYTVPPSYMVGERNPYGIGDTPYPNWQESLTKHNISSTIIDIIKDYLETHAPHDIDDCTEDCTDDCTED